MVAALPDVVKAKDGLELVVVSNKSERTLEENHMVTRVSMLLCDL